MDNHLAQQQHLNNLKAIEDYERRLRALYAKSKNPRPERRFCADLYR